MAVDIFEVFNQRIIGDRAGLEHPDFIAMPLFAVGDQGAGTAF
jgi:hypothetical protein